MEPTRRSVPNAALFEVLEDCLEHNVFDTPLCPICFLSVPESLCGDSPDNPVLQTRYYRLWSACMRLLTAVRTNAEVGQHRRALQVNITTCDMHSPAEHCEILIGWGKSHITDPFELFNIMLCLCLQNCFYGIDSSTGSTRSVVARALNPRKRFRSTKGSWPTDIGQLFPHGEDNTVEALVFACSWLSDDSPLWVLNAVLHLARPRIWPSLLLNKISTRLVCALLAMVTYGINGVTVGLQSQDNGSLRTTNVRDAAWLQDGRGLHAAAEFLHTIVAGPYAQADDIIHFLAPHAAAFRGLFRQGLMQSANLAPGPRQDDWWRILMCIWPASHLTHNARARTTDADVARAAEGSPRGPVILGIVRQALRALPRRCAGPGCARTMLDDTALPTCATCKLARYCMQQCQRADWKTGSPVPHKRLFPILAAMQAVAGPDLSYREYSQRIKESRIADDDLILLGRWALSRGQYYMDLLRLDVTFPHLYGVRERNDERPGVLQSLVES